MRYLVRFGTFWYDFVVGDDWTIAVAVVVALIAVAGLSSFGASNFWLLPVVVIGFLGVSLWRASKPSS